MVRNHDGGKAVDRLSYSAHPTAHRTMSEVVAKLVAEHSGEAAQPVRIWAAHRIGIQTILLTADNEADLADIPADIRKRLTFKLVQTMDEVIAEALLPRSGTILLPELTEPAGVEEVAVANAEDRPRPDTPRQPSL